MDASNHTGSPFTALDKSLNLSMDVFKGIYKFRKALAAVGAEVIQEATRLGPAEVMAISADVSPSVVGTLLFFRNR
jgi:hypothetical protein